MNPPEAGVVIVDATFLKHLAAEKMQEALLAACERRHVRIYPSFVNLTEALKHSNPSARKRLVRALETWQGDGLLLPSPRNLLIASAEAIRDGSEEFLVPEEMLGYLRVDEDKLAADSQSARQFASNLQNSFATSMQSVRPEAQSYLKENALREKWPSLQVFLIDEWRTESNLIQTAEWLWSSVGTGERISGTVLLASEVWRLAVDIFGAGFYYSAVRVEQLKNSPGVMDLLQLLYLSLKKHDRTLVTDDKGLLHAAAGILDASYPNSRALTAADFVGEENQVFPRVAPTPRMKM